MSSKYEYIQQLYLEKISGIISASDEVLLEKMLEEDAECRKIWELLDEEGQIIGASETLSQINVDSELQRLKEKTLHHEKKTRKLRWMTAAAAVILIGVTVVFFRNSERQGKQLAKISRKGAEKVRLLLSNGKSVVLDSAVNTGVVAIGGIQLHTSSNSLEAITGGSATALNTLIVPVTEDYNITLSDGTQIKLNSDSRLKFPSRFAGNLREVYLEGEAFFDVANDVERPFIVHTGLNSVKVLGTSFNLSSYEKGFVKTSLVSGSVLVHSNSGEEVLLKPGLEARFKAGEGFVTERFDREDVLSWMNGVYYFHNKPLSELRIVIKRWFDTDISFDKPELSEKRISGMIEKDELDSFLKDLQTTSDITYYQKGSSLHLTE